MRMWTASAALILTGAVLLTGCGNDKSEGKTSGSGEAKLKIETSFYPMYEFTKQVAGDLADVESLIPAGVEPHDWEPSPKDIAKIQDADVFVYNGAGLEGWVDQVLSAADGSSLTVVEASKGQDMMEGTEEEDHEAEEAGHDDHDHGGLDPHVWLSPVRAVQEVRAIEAALGKADPDNKETYKANADAYAAKLGQLDQEFKSAFAQVKRKDFITQHAAFGYLAKDYGLEQVPIAGLSPEQEPSAEQMAGIVNFAREHKVKTIYFETLVTSKVADTIAKEVGAETAVLNPLEGLTDEEKAQNLDYIGVMKQNLEALKKGLNQ
ncbi:metal ABC transporter substrate-binding protein [Paenibacillus lacisoli]|uniref:metal ABC transporter substrate-binding protein n=1 Tax=Paenibacillus lacisoli TaxID=3064525 RepID=UPI00387E26B4